MRRFAVSLLIFSACVFAQAQQLQVYPRIETGAHSADTGGIDTDTSGRYLFSASNDKTARVWDLKTGRLLRTLRPPIGEGDEGKLYGVAASPEGKMIAVGGFTEADVSNDFPIYIFDRESGTIVSTIRGLPQVTMYLASSRDGRYLIATLGGPNGIRIYKTDGYAEVTRDVDYGSDSYGADFDGHGRVVTTSWDGYLRLYSADFRLLRKQAAPGGKQPYFARFSPDGKLIAVGFSDSMAVDILSGDDLSFEYTLTIPKADPSDNNLSRVVWSSDGGTLCAAGRYSTIDSIFQVVCWSDAGKGILRSFPTAGSSIRDLRALRDGGIAYSDAVGGLGVLAANGTVKWRREPSVLDTRVGVNWPHVSRDGATVETRVYSLSGTTQQEHMLTFSLSEEKLSVETKSQIKLPAPRQTGLKITNWDYSFHPALDGRELPIEEYETSRSLAVAADNASFVLGTEWGIRRFTSNGKKLWRVAAPGVVWGVNITGDGHYVVANLSDGTIRWYSFETGKEVLALFVDRDLTRWVAWTPDGFFTFRNGGDSLIGYQINRGPGQAGDFVKVDQLREAFYRADLVTRVLKPGGAEALAAARKQVGDISQALAGGLPPEIELLSNSTAVVNDNYLLQFRVKNAGGGKGRIVYRIDGTEIEGRDVDIAGTSGDTVSRYIPIGSGAHTLTVSAYSANGKVQGRPVTVNLTGRQPSGKTSLYVVSAGISHYLDNSLSDGVKFAAADANLVAATFKQQEGKGLYQRVDAVALPDSRATAKAIQDEISKAAKTVRPGDTFVFSRTWHFCGW